MSGALSKLINLKTINSKKFKARKNVHSTQSLLHKSVKTWEYIINSLLFRTGNSNKDKVYSYIFRCIYYSDYTLSVAKVTQEQSKATIESVLKIPLPGNIVNDGMVQDSEDMSKIILDMSIALGIKDAPVILLLPSSLFKLYTFNSSDLISKTILDPLIRAKSPYLPIETIIKNEDLNNKFKTLSRVMYVQKKLITSWLNTLEKLNSPIVCLTTHAPHILDMLSKKDTETNTILCDIELSNTTIFINKKEGEVISRKLPYGSALYTSTKAYSDVEKFYIRLRQSVNSLISVEKLDNIKNIYLIGNGLDALMNSREAIPKGFSDIFDKGINSFEYSVSKKLQDSGDISSIMISMAHLTSLALEEL